MGSDGNDGHLYIRKHTQLCRYQLCLLGNFTGCHGDGCRRFNLTGPDVCWLHCPNVKTGLVAFVGFLRLLHCLGGRRSPGTWISTQFGWRISFLTVIVISIMTMGLVFFSLPRDFKQKESTISGQLALLKDHKIQVGMLLPMFNLAAIYVFYTYLRPIITNQLHFSVQMLTILLGVFGISNIIGNRVSGLISEGPGLRAMPLVYISQLILMALMPLVFHYSWPGAVLLFLVIFTMPLINSPIQLFFLSIAEKKYPQSIVLASSLNSIFSNFGIALGSATGGIIVSHLSLNGVGPGGAVYALVSLGLVLWLNHMTQKGLSSAPNSL